MGLVVVGLELLKQSLKLGLVQIVVDFGVEKGLHLVKVGGVEPWRQQRLLDGFLRSALALFGGGGRRHSDHGAPLAAAAASGIPKLRSRNIAEIGHGFHKRHCYRTPSHSLTPDDARAKTEGCSGALNQLDWTGLDCRIRYHSPLQLVPTRYNLIQ